MHEARSCDVCNKQNLRERLERTDYCATYHICRAVLPKAHKRVQTSRERGAAALRAAKLRGGNAHFNFRTPFFIFSKTGAQHDSPPARTEDRVGGPFERTGLTSTTSSSTTTRCVGFSFRHRRRCRLLSVCRVGGGPRQQQQRAQASVVASAGQAVAVAPAQTKAAAAAAAAAVGAYRHYCCSRMSVPAAPAV